MPNFDLPSLFYFVGIFEILLVNAAVVFFWVVKK